MRLMPVSSTVAVGLALLALAGAAQAAPTGWMLTLLDGEAVVIDGTRRLAGVPGLPLSAGALIETGAQTALARLEGPDMASVDLGPATRAMLLPPAQASRGGRVPTVYVQQGWAKVIGRGSAPLAGAAAAGFDTGSFTGALVLHVAGGEQSAFAETARAEIAERRTGAPALRLAPGEFYRGDGVKPGAASPRPDPAWLKALPRAFRDPIPLRAANFKNNPATPTALPGPTYDQLAPWLAAEPYVRRDFTQRFAPLLRDAAFRRAVQANLKSHPEWASLLAPKDATESPPR
jgi:hypothetical protein